MARKASRSLRPGLVAATGGTTLTPFVVAVLTSQQFAGERRHRVGYMDAVFAGTRCNSLEFSSEMPGMVVTKRHHGSHRNRCFGYFSVLRLAGSIQYWSLLATLMKNDEPLPPPA